MDPVEINAGAWYLRAMRADDRISDVAALRDLGVSEPTDYVAAAERGWADESSFAWAVCEPTTGELVAVVTVTAHDTGSATLDGRARSGYDDALDAARGPITRFTEGALGLCIASG